MVIKRQRLLLSLTHKQLAEMVGCTGQTVSGWERGISTPQTGKIPHLAEVLGIDPQYLAKLCNKRLNSNVVPIRPNLINESKETARDFRSEILETILKRVNAASADLSESETRALELAARLILEPGQPQ
jgi:transcriptional regulator with XRE-family HTH domain